MITPFIYKLKLTGAGVEKYNGDYIRSSGGNTAFINNQNGCSITMPSIFSPIWDLQDPNFPGDEKTIYMTDLDFEYWSVNIIIPIGPIVPGAPPIAQIFWKNKNLIKGDGGTGKLVGYSCGYQNLIPLASKFNQAITPSVSSFEGVLSNSNSFQDFCTSRNLDPEAILNGLGQVNFASHFLFIKIFPVGTTGSISILASSFENTGNNTIKATIPARTRRLCFGDGCPSYYGVYVMCKRGWSTLHVNMGQIDNFYPIV